MMKVKYDSPSLMLDSADATGSTTLTTAKLDVDTVKRLIKELQADPRLQPVKRTITANFYGPMGTLEATKTIKDTQVFLVPVVSGPLSYSMYENIVPSAQVRTVRYENVGREPVSGAPVYKFVYRGEA